MALEILPAQSPPKPQKQPIVKKTIKKIKSLPKIGFHEETIYKDINDWEGCSCNHSSSYVCCNRKEFDDYCNCLCHRINNSDTSIK